MSTWVGRHRIPLALLLAAALPALVGTALSEVPDQAPLLLEEHMGEEAWDPETMLPWPHRFVAPGSRIGIPLDPLLVFGAAIAGAALLSVFALWILGRFRVSRDAPLTAAVGAILLVTCLVVVGLIAAPEHELPLKLIAMAVSSLVYLAQYGAWFAVLSRLSRA